MEQTTVAAAVAATAAHALRIMGAIVVPTIAEEARATRDMSAKSVTANCQSRQFQSPAPVIETAALPASGTYQFIATVNFQQ
jgi:hypothetical protein